MLPIETTLQRNTGANKLQVPYFAHVECPHLLNFGPSFVIPIKAAYVGMKKTMSVDVCGFRLMSEHLSAIPSIVARLIEGVAHSGRLPHYVFIARDAGSIYPVYTVKDEVMVPTPNGPRFQHVELAKVRERLSDYLHEIKVLGTHGATDKLHVRGISRHSLQLKRPSFYLKKRVQNEDDFWAPVFQSHDGEEIYAYAANQRQSAPVTDGSEVFKLHAAVSNALIDDNRLNNAHDLRPDRIFSDTWEQLRATYFTPIADELVVSGVPVPLFAAADGMIAGLEVRPDEDRYSLFLGNSKEEVNDRANRDFARRGISI